MAAGALLYGEIADFSVLVDSDVMHEFTVRLGVVLSPKRSSRLFSSKAALNRRGDHSNGRLGSKHFEQVRVGDEG